MSGKYTLYGQIKNPRSKVYRKLFIKRRQQGTGLYEDDWVDITKDVIKWGTIRKAVDATKVNSFNFSNITLVMDNSSGRYNPESDEQSIWYGYGDQQRTLVKITAGFLVQEKGEDGLWSNINIPGNAYFDEAYFDAEAYFDSESTIYSGFISGDINVVGNNQINIPIVPLMEVFRQFPASRLTGYNSSLTASDFITLLRDQQDANGSYIFRPFFNDTTTNWEITSTSVEYGNLNTSTAQDVLDSTVWDVVQKLAEAENHVPIITADAIFKFRPRDITTTPVYEFYGAGAYSSQYGRQIKKIGFYGKRYTKYYSRVSVKYREADTSTSYATEESQYLVSGSSGPWTLGERTLNIDNLWIPTSTVAETIAESLFEEFSAIKREIEFTTSFVPQLEVLDRVLISYDESGITENSLWDVYNWADSATGASTMDDLIWDDSDGDSIKLLDEEFKLIAIDLNLDSFECKFVGRK